MGLLIVVYLAAFALLCGTVYNTGIRVERIETMLEEMKKPEGEEPKQ